MRNKTPKRAAADRKADKLRNEFREEVPNCMICMHTATDVHEIVRGPGRAQAYGERCTWLHLCRECHEDCGDYEKWPVARQYAVKAITDPEHYDRIKCNLLRGRDENSIDETDVARELLNAIYEMES